MALTATLMPLAWATERQESTAASPEQVDVVGALRALARSAACQRILIGEATSRDWAELTDAPHRLACVCQAQVVIDAETLGRP